MKRKGKFVKAEGEIFEIFEKYKFTYAETLGFLEIVKADILDMLSQLNEIEIFKKSIQKWKREKDIKGFH